MPVTEVDGMPQDLAGPFLHWGVPPGSAQMPGIANGWVDVPKAFFLYNFNVLNNLPDSAFER